MPQVTSEHQNKIREKILKSTYRLFVREGERMTTQMVCDDAHVSKGTLFHYFGSKETLLRTAYTSAHEHAGRLSSEGMEFSGSEKEIVQELVRRSLVWALDFPEEVIFSERYNDVMHNSLATSTFHSEITGLFDVPALLEKLLPPDSQTLSGICHDQRIHHGVSSIGVCRLLSADGSGRCVYSVRI